MIAGFEAGGEVLAIYCFCKDPGTGCFPDSSGPAEQKCLGHLIGTDGILQCLGN